MTAEEVNALPEPIRRYIHDLETRCDPAGELRELAIARETCRALETRVREGADALLSLVRGVEDLQREWPTLNLPSEGLHNDLIGFLFATLPLAQRYLEESEERKC